MHILVTWKSYITVLPHTIIFLSLDCIDRRRTGGAICGTIGWKVSENGKWLVGRLVEVSGIQKKHWWGVDFTTALGAKHLSCSVPLWQGGPGQLPLFPSFKSSTAKTNLHWFQSLKLKVMITKWPSLQLKARNSLPIDLIFISLEAWLPWCLDCPPVRAFEQPLGLLMGRVPAGGHGVAMKWGKLRLW